MGDRTVPRLTYLLPVRIVEPWQVDMTIAAIRQAMRAAAEPPRIIVVEAGRSDLAAAMLRECGQADPLHLGFDPPIGYVPELNAGLDRVQTEFVAAGGNDIFLPDGWDRALLAPFARFPDCGISTLASSDLQHKPRPGVIAEGVWGPLMCFRRDWRFDPDFKRLFIDTDLIMRVYEAGQRSYRNWGAVATHLNQVTHRAMYDKAETDKMLAEGKAVFVGKHAGPGGHMLMFRALTEGWIV